MSAALPHATVAVAPGDTMPDYRFGPLTRTHLVRYAGAAGDFNPLHHDDEAARSQGFPGVFGMGMLTAGILGVRLARWLGPESVVTYQVRFAGQVWPGDELRCSGRIDAIEARDGGPVARVSLTVTRDDELVLRATAIARVARP